MAQKGLTVEQAAQVGRCSTSQINYMLRDGHLKGTRKAPRSPWTVTTPRKDIRALVTKHHPKAGWVKGGGKKTAVSAGLNDALKFAALPKTTRTLLLRLAKKSDADLRVMVTL